MRHRCLLVVVFEASIISVLQVSTGCTAATPPIIVIHRVLFIRLLWRPLIVIIVAILDHLVAHNRTVAIDRHSVVVSTAIAAYLVWLVQETLPMHIWRRRAISTLHQRRQILLASRCTNLTTLGCAHGA